MMDVGDVLDLMRERVRFYADCGDMSAAAGALDEAEVMDAGARQWQEALDIVRHLCAQIEHAAAGPRTAPHSGPGMIPAPSS